MIFKGQMKVFTLNIALLHYNKCYKNLTRSFYYQLRDLKLLTSSKPRGVTLISRRVLQGLMWVYNVCYGISFRIIRVYTVIILLKFTGVQTAYFR